ncbi:hemophore-related protein [Mycolicibacterium vaccae]|uniref:hemophore-related protein n=1 Tax=Mycolicibacterium vaccae TaxID=1810 RepID=UPI003CFCB9C5
MSSQMRLPGGLAALSALVVGATALAAPAVAQPDLGPILTTQCSYEQVTAAIEARDAEAAQQLAGAPAAQAILQQFLQAPTDTRAQLAGQVQALPGAQRYFGLIASVARECAEF